MARPRLCRDEGTTLTPGKIEPAFFLRLAFAAGVEKTLLKLMKYQK